MRKYRNCLICISLAMLVAATASAQIVDEKAVADFTNFYTGADLAASADWTVAGTGGVVEGTQLRYNLASHNASYQWVNALPQDSGWTLEMKLEVTQPSSDGKNGFGGLISDGTLGQYNVLFVNQDGVAGFEKDMTGGMHEVRIAESAGDGGGRLSLWIDQALYAGSLSGVPPHEIVRCWLGEFSSSQVDGEVLIDHVAIDTTGAYAPVDQLLPIPPVAEDLAEAASSTFDYQYEMDKDPTNPAEIDLDSNGAADFVFVTGGGSTNEFTPEGTWHVTSPAAGDTCYMDGGITSETALWRAGSFTADEGFTVEVRMKVLSETEPLEDEVFQTCSIAAAPEDANEVGAMVVKKNETLAWGTDQVADADNSDDFHVFRMVRDEAVTIEGELTQGAFWTWRDGVLISEEPAPSIWGGVRDALYFGDMSGSAGGEFEIDYVRFTSGMYAPEGWTYPPEDTGRRPQRRRDGRQCRFGPGSIQLGSSRDRRSGGR